MIPFHKKYKFIYILPTNQFLWRWWLPPTSFPHEYLQPIEINILYYIHNTEYNHKIYSLIQNPRHEFSFNSKELKIIKAQELLWSLLQTKNIICMHLKFITSSDTNQTDFTNRFFDDDTLRAHAQNFSTNNYIQPLTIL